VVVGVMVGFVLPAFAGLYDSIGAELPPITKMVMGLSDMLRANVLSIMAVLLVSGMVFLAYSRTTDGKYKIDKMMLRLPLMGKIKQLNELSRCSRSIALLFRAGLPLTEIMPLVIESANSRTMARALYDVQQDMLKGEGLAQPMAKNSLFLPMLVQMVKVGEETGSLDNSLMAVAQSYETEVEDKTRSLIGLIQPVMTLIIAMIVGVIALSLVSAMYSMYGQTF